MRQVEKMKKKRWYEKAKKGKSEEMGKKRAHKEEKGLKETRLNEIRL